MGRLTSSSGKQFAIFHKTQWTRKNAFPANYEDEMNEIPMIDAKYLFQSIHDMSKSELLYGKEPRCSNLVHD